MPYGDEVAGRGLSAQARWSCYQPRSCRMMHRVMTLSEALIAVAAGDDALDRAVDRDLHRGDRAERGRGRRDAAEPSCEGEVGPSDYD